MATHPTQPGTFIISLDFELNWGVRDQQTLAQYGANILGVRQAVPAMLGLFAEFGLRVTWATVGLLFFKTKAQLLAHLPAVLPHYADTRLSPYEGLVAIGEDEATDPYHFGHSLVEQIRQVPGQEMATHTYCHYYCLERGQTAESFQADLAMAVQTAQEHGFEPPRSLVFPRNQYNPAYLEICRSLGLTNYRGNEMSWIYKERSEEQQTYAKRGARLLDAYLNLSGHHGFSLAEAALSGPPYNLPASRFLRPWSGKIPGLERLRLRRILASMTHAAQQGLAFHLWWHPHNFGKNLAENIAVLRRIAEHYMALNARYGFRSMTMAEVAEELSNQYPSAR
jgi:peptidoglycan/xylan/chitin deacetylase (PgdA/CDA1 family)